MSDTTNDKEWQRVIQQMITSDNEWQWVIMIDAMSDNEWQRVVQQMKTNECE